MQGFEKVEKAIRELIATEFPEVFVVDIALTQGPRSVLSVLIDTDQGISIGVCAHISRKFNIWLEANDPFEFPFVMEFSSPGLGKPLKILRQYHKNVGRNLKVKTTTGESHVGKLVEVTDTGIVLQPVIKKKSKKALESETTHISLAFEVIQEAKVEISFD